MIAAFLAPARAAAHRRRSFSLPPRRKPGLFSAARAGDGRQDITVAREFRAAKHEFRLSSGRRETGVKMASSTEPSREKARAYRRHLRRQGLRPIEIWVPDVH